MPDIRQIKDEVVGATKNYVDTRDAATLAAAEAYTDAAVVGLGTGDVHGPASSTDGDFVQFNGATGKIIKDGAFKPSSFDTAGAAAAALVTAEAYTDTQIAGVNQYSDEKVDDRVSVLVQNGTGISWSYNDPAGTFTPTVTLAPFSTTNLAEGSNLYFTDERAEDAVGGILTDTATIDFTYNDGANTITADVKDASITFAKMQAITDGKLLGASGGILVEEITPSTGLTLSANNLSVTLAPFSTSDLSEGSRLYYTDERVDDRVAVLIQNGTGISWSYNDPSGTLTPTVTLAPFSTTNLSEGTNLYYTNARVDARIFARNLMGF